MIVPENKGELNFLVQSERKEYHAERKAVPEGDTIQGGKDMQAIEMQAKVTKGREIRLKLPHHMILLLL